MTTNYLVDTNNLTGYAQVVEEIQSNTVVKTYTYGLDLISQRSASGVNFYQYDGHGSVRGLTDASANLTDTYAYDAFGTITEQTGTTQNNYLYAGEQFDPDLGFYYNRARYLNAETGRFLTSDRFEGALHSPHALHKYTYGLNNPVTFVDPSGFVAMNWDEWWYPLLLGTYVHLEIGTHFVGMTGFSFRTANYSTIGMILTQAGSPNAYCDGCSLKPDLVDFTVRKVWEIKPASVGIAAGQAQLLVYLAILNHYDTTVPLAGLWMFGDWSYMPPSSFILSKAPIPGTWLIRTQPPQNGVILYEALSIERTLATLGALSFLAAGLLAQSLAPTFSALFTGRRFAQ